ncbi:MAG: isoprenoid biosynthesis glyoxalase ElbB [Verrucomicrobiota bacterium]
MAQKVGVLLSGCGYLDGAEIHESVCTLLALDEAGAEAVCMAPDVTLDVVDHITGEPTGEQRNVLAESARIARGQIQDVTAVDVSSLDALILPGGFGAAKNLSDFASEGSGMTVRPEVEQLIKAVHEAGKPIGAICIAPAVISKLLPGVSLTIGNDVSTSRTLEAMGSIHCECPVDEFTVDAENKVVSTPAYMLGPWIKDVNTGIARCVAEVLGMIDAG